VAEGTSCGCVDTENQKEAATDPWPGACHFLGAPSLNSCCAGGKLEERFGGRQHIIEALAIADGLGLAVVREELELEL